LPAIEAGAPPHSVRGSREPSLYHTRRTKRPAGTSLTQVSGYAGRVKLWRAGRGRPRARASFSTLAREGPDGADIDLAEDVGVLAPPESSARTGSRRPRWPGAAKVQCQPDTCFICGIHSCSTDRLSRAVRPGSVGSLRFTECGRGLPGGLGGWLQEFPRPGLMEEAGYLVVHEVAADQASAEPLLERAGRPGIRTRRSNSSQCARGSPRGGAPRTVSCHA